MALKRLVTVLGTAIITATALLGVDLLLDGELGFLSTGALPYVAMAMLLSIIVHPLCGLVAATWSVLLLFIVVPWIEQQWGTGFTIPNVVDITREQRVVILFMVLAGYAVYRVYARVQIDRDQLRTRRRAQDEENRQLQIQNYSYEDSLQNLYNRIAVESRSITMLAELLPQLYSFNRQDVLEASLEAAGLMCNAGIAALYRFDETSLSLQREGARPRRAEEVFPPQLDAAASIEGWVVRSGSQFSLRLLLHDESLRALHQGRSTIAVPVMIRGRVWGVLSVGEIPFLQYNQYAERALQIVAALSVPGLEQSFGVVGDAGENEPGEETAMGSIDDLHDDLASALENGGQASLFLIELTSNGSSQLAISPDAYDDLVVQVARTLVSISGGAARAYRYQLQGQLALVAVSQGFDAASYFLLRILEAINGRAWTVEDDTVLPQAVVGFASSSQVGGDAEALIAKAESVLILQRGSGCA